MAYYYRRTDELYHHGIKGQKWGIRRFQNPDGSLTPEGRVRYSKYIDTNREDRLRNDLKRASQMLSKYDTNINYKSRCDARAAVADLLYSSDPDISDNDATVKDFFNVLSNQKGPGDVITGETVALFDGGNIAKAMNLYDTAMNHSSDIYRHMLNAGLNALNTKKKQLLEDHYHSLVPVFNDSFQRLDRATKSFRYKKSDAFKNALEVGEWSCSNYIENADSLIKKLLGGNFDFTNNFNSFPDVSVDIIAFNIPSKVKRKSIYSLTSDDIEEITKAKKQSENINKDILEQLKRFPKN